MCKFIGVTTLLVLGSAVGCSSSTTTETGKQALQDAAPSTDNDSGSDPDAATGAGDDASVSALKAPTITGMMSMAGGLHITWKNNQPDCDSIEGERKTSTEVYKVVFTIPDGTVDNKHDGPLTAGTTYTYRLRCKKGTDYSPYSNEKSGKP